ncbi:MAG: 50S ribosomal protein L6 [Nanoarchaeota archaeon]|nr:50S ribosomal protein L6 [Nanoarchaeota archaeon]
MKKKLERIIEVPQGMDALINANEITLRKNGKEMKRKFDISSMQFSVEGNAQSAKVKIYCDNATRRESKMIGTIWAHINNMIAGLEKDFVYKLEICNVHFPMNAKVEGENLVIKSFLGEKVPRIAKIQPNTKVEIKGSEITVSSFDLESAGQTAANFERATKIRGRDRRVFQDGIFITEKCGVKI